MDFFFGIYGSLKYNAGSFSDVSASIGQHHDTIVMHDSNNTAGPIISVPCVGCDSSACNETVPDKHALVLNSPGTVQELPLLAFILQELLYTFILQSRNGVPTTVTHDQLFEQVSSWDQVSQFIGESAISKLPLCHFWPLQKYLTRAAKHELKTITGPIGKPTLFSLFHVVLC